MRAIEGNCAACGEKAVRRVKIGRKVLLGCNRCATRVRKGTDFYRPFARREERREKMLARMKSLSREGLTLAEIARRCGVCRDTVVSYLDAGRTDTR